ncbi:MAG: (2Fe-2S)-binding protein [Ketobacteraceae bacterium]|nr:(2Fe-2S)-binding protein [Ketobacteraceae bacterium]
MLVCICNRISENDIRDAVYDGASGYKQVRSNLGVGNCCGQCASYAKNLVKETVSQLQLAKINQLVTEIKL